MNVVNESHEEKSWYNTSILRTLAHIRETKGVLQGSERCVAYDRTCDEKKEEKCLAKQYSSR